MPPSNRPGHLMFWKTLVHQWNDGAYGRSLTAPQLVRAQGLSAMTFLGGNGLGSGFRGSCSGRVAAS